MEPLDLKKKKSIFDEIPSSPFSPLKLQVSVMVILCMNFDSEMIDLAHGKLLLDKENSGNTDNIKEKLD